MAKKRDEKREAKKFGVVVGIALVLIGGWLLYRGGTTAPYVLFGVAAPMVLLPFAAAQLWLKFFRLWMKVAEAISFVMTRVILSTFFFLILTPVGLIMRILGKTPLDLVYKDGKASYWIAK